MSRGSGSNMVAKRSEIVDTGSLATRVHMSDYFKVKINEENEASSDVKHRWADLNMGCVTSPPHPMARKHSSCPYMAQGHADERRSAERIRYFY